MPNCGKLFLSPHRGKERSPAHMISLRGWKQWARTIKRDAHALYLASRDPRVPWYAKALALAAYALSPFDLIPDFIPVLGYLDDLIIVPAGIWLVIGLIPPAVLDEHRKLAEATRDQPVSLLGAAAIVTLWFIAIAACAWLVWKQLH